MASEGRRLLLGLITVQIGDATFNVLAKQWTIKDLEHLGFPTDHRFAFPVIKSASAIGLLAGLRWPRLGRLTAALLVLYFLIALGFHARAKDRPMRYLPAVAMLVWSIRALRAYPVEELR